MDPKACLSHALDSYYRMKYDDAISALSSYHTWRVRGGFEPTMNGGTKGDDYRDRLMKKIGDALMVLTTPWEPDELDEEYPDYRA